MLFLWVKQTGLCFGLAGRAEESGKERSKPLVIHLLPSAVPLALGNRKYLLVQTCSLGSGDQIQKSQCRGFLLGSLGMSYSMQNWVYAKDYF